MKKKSIKSDEKAFIERLKSDCPKCGGTGQSFNVKIAGEALRAFRMKLGITATSIAEEVGLSLTEVSYRERAKRNFGEDFVVEYIRAVKRIHAKQGRVK